jgi:hypothetical protein
MRLVVGVVRTRSKEKILKGCNLSRRINRVGIRMNFSVLHFRALRSSQGLKRYLKSSRVDLLKRSKQ